jgi:glutamine phosphoribosylpyrophosphate amidotransferase
MCGINAVLLADTSANAAVELVDSLGLLQHRGQVILYQFTFRMLQE